MKNRARTITMRQLRAERLVLFLPVLHVDRPQVRADCVDGPRPCPYVGCQYHLYLDVSRAGGVVLNFPDLEPDQLEESCALDVADRGPHTLEAVAPYLGGLTRERVRQIEEIALRKLERHEVLRGHL